MICCLSLHHAWESIVEEFGLTRYMLDKRFKREYILPLFSELCKLAINNYMLIADNEAFEDAVYSSRILEVMPEELRDNFMYLLPEVFNQITTDLTLMQIPDVRAVLDVTTTDLTIQI